MRQPFQFKRTVLYFCLILVVAVLILSGAFPSSLSAAQGISPTGTGVPVATASNAYITVTYIEPINVRSGPSSFDYPIIGSLPVGGKATAIGRSPHGEWIQILYNDTPQGIGWVYAANVSLSTGASLPIVEPPPTPTPQVTPTINPTFEAAFQNQPTATRLPTFTSPPPLKFPSYSNPMVSSSSRAITTWVIIGLGLLGIAGILLTSLKRR